jgi:hypothetical protein
VRRTERRATHSNCELKLHSLPDGRAINGISPFCFLKQGEALALAVVRSAFSIIWMQFDGWFRLAIALAMTFTILDGMTK